MIHRTRRWVFSRAWGVSCIFIVYLGLFAVIGTAGRIGPYHYR